MTRTDRILRLLAWPAAIWIAYEFLWYAAVQADRPSGVGGLHIPAAGDLVRHPGL